MYNGMSEAINNDEISKYDESDDFGEKMLQYHMAFPTGEGVLTAGPGSPMTLLPSSIPHFREGREGGAGRKASCWSTEMQKPDGPIPIFHNRSLQRLVNISCIFC